MRKIIALMVLCGSFLFASMNLQTASKDELMSIKGIGEKKALQIMEYRKSNWTTSNADYWFDNNFLVYGSQRVKDTEDKTRRKVFFVNKISF